MMSNFYLQVTDICCGDVVDLVVLRPNTREMPAERHREASPWRIAKRVRARLVRQASDAPVPDLAASVTRPQPA